MGRFKSSPPKASPQHGRQLAAHQAKRDFSKTAGPSGETKTAPSKQLRFVIQKHDATRLHYDLRLETDEFDIRLIKPALIRWNPISAAVSVTR